MNICVTELCVWMTKSCYFNRYSKWTRQYIFYVLTPQAFEHVWAWLLSNSQEKKKRELKSAIIKNVYSPNMYFAFFPFCHQKIINLEVWLYAHCCSSSFKKPPKFLPPEQCFNSQLTSLTMASRFALSTKTSGSGPPSSNCCMRTISDGLSSTA